MKRFYILLVIAAMVFAACQEDTNPPVFQTPELHTGVTVSYHEATIKDTVRFHSGKVVLKILYSTDSTMNSGVKEVTPVLSKADSCYEFTSTLSNLTDNTIYYYVYSFISEFGAKNGKEGVRGKMRSFRTLENQAPEVVTTGCTEYGFYTASLVCEKVSDNSDSKTTEWGVCYATSSNPKTSNNKVKSSSNNNMSCTFSISGLSAGTKYYYRAYGINKYGTSYGEEKSFTTASESVMGVETYIPTSKGKNFAILSGKVTDNASLNITEKGFYLSATNQDPGESDTKVKCEVSGEGAYQCQVNGLSSNTDYFVCAYAICQYGTLKGNVVMFTTEQ